MIKYYDYMNESEMAFSDIDISKINPFKDEPNQDLEYLSLKEIGKNGKLAEYIDKGYVLRFGMLKALYNDAIAYKKRRELIKGYAKFAVRIIPLALAPIFFPIWLMSQILGASRALNKIIYPTLIMNSDNYDSFLINLINKIMSVAEGDIKPFLEDDWFYKVFYVHDGLTKMVRQEHIFKFSIFISKKIQKKDDMTIVPHYWLDIEFRKWLNDQFNVNLPTGKGIIKKLNEL